MRNVFHQYSQPENRLSHALACALHEDERLLRAFLRWSNCALPARSEQLRVVEQQSPGEIEDGSDEACGLPDISIFGDEGFGLLVESKVAAAINTAQLRRHQRTAERAGFPAAQVLVLATDVRTMPSLPRTSARTWPELYSMVSAEQARSEWARRLVEYMEILEVDLAQNGYLREGTLTQFCGIPFDEEAPYRYGQAKRLLRLMLDELRQREDLHELGVSAEGAGRPAITGARGQYVWDFLRLGVAGTGVFTKHPHLTLSLHPDYVGAMVTLPNDAAGRYRKHIKSVGAEGLKTLVGEVSDGLERATRGIQRVRPVMYVVQRHFTSQRSKGIEDARLEFDLRTTLPAARDKVRPQPEWIDAVFDVIASKQSNLQVGIGAQLPYDSEIVRSRGVLDHVAAVWIALEPWLERGLGIPLDRT